MGDRAKEFVENLQEGPEAELDELLGGIDTLLSATMDLPTVELALRRLRVSVADAKESLIGLGTAVAALTDEQVASLENHVAELHHDR